MGSRDNQRGGRNNRKQRGAGRAKEVQARIDKEGWTPEFLAAMQGADVDIGALKSWMSGEAERPDWDTVRGESPSLKAYWNQWGPSRSTMVWYTGS